MTWQMLIVFRLLAATFALMVREKLSLDLVAVLASALLVTGILTPAEAKVFSYAASITLGISLSSAPEESQWPQAAGYRTLRQWK